MRQGGNRGSFDRGSSRNEKTRRDPLCPTSEELDSCESSRVPSLVRPGLPSMCSRSGAHVGGHGSRAQVGDSLPGSPQEFSKRPQKFGAARGCPESANERWYCETPLSPLVHPEKVRAIVRAATMDSQAPPGSASSGDFHFVQYKWPLPSSRLRPHARCRANRNR